MHSENNILSLFHHIHHDGNDHEVHHCGGIHSSIDPSVNYTIIHCECGKHTINTNTAIGHATDKQLNQIEVLVTFTELCPSGGWHVESGTKSIE